MRNQLLSHGQRSAFSKIVNHLIQDVRLTSRRLRGALLNQTVVEIPIGLGIGANSAVFLEQ